ncbi:MAG: accessory factor UbiK family protein [Pseudomonadota bacterium]
MDSGTRPFDGLARGALGALSALSALRRETEDFVRQRLDRLLADRGLVTREEFDAVKEMAAKAQAGQAALEKRLAALEAALGQATEKK